MRSPSRLLLTLIGIAIWTVPTAHGQVSTSLPTTSGSVGDTPLLPVTVGDLSGLNVVSFDFTITYDPALLSIDGISNAGTLAGACSVQANNPQAGRLVVSGGCTSALTGSGTLVELQATYAATGTSSLTWSQFLFNEGDPPVTLTNGSVTIETGGESSTVPISLPSASGSVGDTPLLPVTVGDLSGLDVFSFDFTITYDPALLSIDGVSNAGTLVSACSVQGNNPQAGQLVVSGGCTSALSGAGTLVELQATYDATGTSSLTWSQFLFNEGDPTVTLTDGAVVIASASNVVAVDDQAATNEDAAVVINVVANDQAPAGLDPASVVITAPPANGTATPAAGGTVRYTPNLDFNGSDSFGYRVSDTQEATSNEAQVAVSVAPVNDPPGLVASQPPTSAEDAGPVVVPGWAGFVPNGANSDDEASQTVRAFHVNGVSNPALFRQMPLISTSGALSYESAENAHGSSSFVVVVQDDAGGNDRSPPRTFAIIVNPVNDPPQLSTNAALQVVQGESAVIGSNHLQATDVDNGPSELTYTLQIPPQSGQLLISGVSLAAGASFTQVVVNGNSLSYRHDGGTAVTDRFVFAVADPQGESVSGTFPISVTPSGKKTLMVGSQDPDSGVTIAVNLPDDSGESDGVTPFERRYDDGAQLMLTTSGDTPGGNTFVGWLVNGSFATVETTLSLTMDTDQSVVAVYVPVARTLMIESANPNAGVAMLVSPLDHNGQGNGATPFTRTYFSPTQSVTLAAPSESDTGNPFGRWSCSDQAGGTQESTNRALTVDISNDPTCVATYLTAPQQGGNEIVGDGTVVLSWTTTTGADRYHLQVSDQPFTNKSADILVDVDTLTTTSFVIGAGTLSDARNYNWRIRSGVEDAGSGVRWSSWSDQMVIPTDVERLHEPVPTNTRLEVYPNPTAGLVTFRYAVPSDDPVSLRVFDVVGREIRSLLSAPHPTGVYETGFDFGHLPAGTYYCILQVGQQVQTRAMVVLD